LIQLIARASQPFRLITQHALGCFLDAFPQFRDALARVGLRLPGFVHEAPIEHLPGGIERLIGVGPGRLARRFL